MSKDLLARILANALSEPKKETRTCVVSQVEDQGDRVLLHADEFSDYYVIAPAGCEAKTGDTIEYEWDSDYANFGWFEKIAES